MAKTEGVAESEGGAASDIRGKLITRLAVAGVLVAVLLGILAFFDHLATAPEDDDAVVFSKPVPVAPKKPVSQPVTPAELPDPPAPEPVEVPPPVVDVTPPVPPLAEAKTELKPEAKQEPKPESKSEPKPESRPESHIAPGSANHVKPRLTSPSSQPQVALAAPSQARVARGSPEWTAPPVIDTEAAPRPAPAVAAAKPSARVVETRGAPSAPTGVSRLFSGFLLQAGVFSSAQRAEELHAKLTLSGVQSTLETRVQVGPFRTRQEAEAAQAKLRELGVDTVLVPPRSGR